MTEHEQLRLQQCRYKILLEAESQPRGVSKVCRHYGISRQTFYKWKNRYEAEGEAGLRDQHRAPHHSPRATPPDTVEKILYLRQQYGFGPLRIRKHLKNHHEVTIATQTIYRILRKHGLNRLPLKIAPQLGKQS